MWQPTLDPTWSIGSGNCVRRSNRKPMFRDTKPNPSDRPFPPGRKIYSKVSEKKPNWSPPPPYDKNNQVRMNCDCRRRRRRRRQYYQQRKKCQWSRRTSTWRLHPRPVRTTTTTWGQSQYCCSVTFIRNGNGSWISWRPRFIDRRNHGWPSMWSIPWTPWRSFRVPECNIRWPKWFCYETKSKRIILIGTRPRQWAKTHLRRR